MTTLGRVWRKVPRKPSPSRSPSVRPARSHSLQVERHLPGPPRHPPLPGVSLFRCFRCYLDRPPALHGPLRYPSPPGVSRFRRIGSHLRHVTQASWPGTMAAGAREQAASCDAFVLSRRLPAPGAPPSRTSPACLVAKPFPEPSPNHGPVTSWPGLPLRIPSGSVKDTPPGQRSGHGRHDRQGLAGRVGHARPALRALQGLPSLPRQTENSVRAPPYLTDEPPLLSALARTLSAPHGHLRHPPLPGVSLFRHFRCYLRVLPPAPRPWNITSANAWNIAVRTRGVFTHRDDFGKPACVERGLVRTGLAAGEDKQQSGKAADECRWKQAAAGGDR